MREDSTLTRIQEEHREWVEKNFPGESIEQRTLGVCEEAGELAHHVLKMQQKIRGSKLYHLGEAVDAIGDLCIFALGVCDYLEVDLQEVIENTWEDVKKRNWIEDPDTGQPVRVPNYEETSAELPGGPESATEHNHPGYP